MKGGLQPPQPPTGSASEWNGVGIVLSKELKEDLISVSRKSDPVTSIELGLEEMVIHIMCAQQVGCIENEK